MEAQIAHPPIASKEEWTKVRIELLEREKEHTREGDRINAQRRRLPMVEVTKEYIFDTNDGKKTLLELFDGRRQLIVYHFMLGPGWEKPCPGCSAYISAFGDISDLADKDISWVMVSRAPLDEINKVKADKGWERPWHSSFGSDFNYDYHASLDADVVPIEYNYEPMEAFANGRTPEQMKGETPGNSVFFRIGDKVYHTYSSYARGGEALVHSYALMDITPYGRQQEFEDSPEGWPQKPTYG